MAGGPDLFVVCKNCQAEVSPYITECPYCGHRLRKRAPKLDKGAVPKKPRRTPRPSRSRVRPPHREGRGLQLSSGRPYAAIAIVLVSVIASLVIRSTLVDPADVLSGFADDPWRAVTSLFLYVGEGSTGYEVVALAVAFLFGWLLERRHGLWAPLLVFLIGGAGGIYVAMLLEPAVISTGANGGALALLGAWAVRDILARRMGEEVESDGLGVVAIAVLLILLPIGAEQAHPIAGAAGGLIGLAFGLPLARMRVRE